MRVVNGNGKRDKVYRWQKNIRYISVKSSLSSGWAGHPANETLAQGYGDCTDKSIDGLSLVTEFERKSRRIPAKDYAGFRRDALPIQQLTQKPVYLRVNETVHVQN